MSARVLAGSMLALAGLASAAHATSDDAVRFGPPWIAIEAPANPHHSSTRDATFLIRAYHHSTAITPDMRAVAEGLVKGQRRSVPVDVRPTHLPGVFAVHCDLPNEGTWIVAVTLAEEGGAQATALVDIGVKGRIAGIEVPTRRTPDGWVVPVAVSGADIEARLRSAERRLGANEAPARGLNAGLAGLVLLGLVLGTRRRTAR